MTNAEQNEPVQHGSLDAAQHAKVHGILLQVAADHELRPEEDVVLVLTQRLKDAGITLSEESIVGLTHGLPTISDSTGTAPA